MVGTQDASVVALTLLGAIWQGFLRRASAAHVGAVGSLLDEFRLRRHDLALAGHPLDRLRYAEKALPWLG